MGKVTLELKLLGNDCVLWQSGMEMSLETSLFLIQFAKHLQSKAVKAIREVTQSYTEIGIYYDPLKIELMELELWFSQEYDIFTRQVKLGQEPTKQRTHEIPVIYDGEDLQSLAEEKHLSPEEVIHIHSQASYLVALKGFLPHFPYLLGLDKRLHMERRPTPRPRVPVGAVAIGGMQTGIYPKESPGGWHLIGHVSQEIIHNVLPIIVPGDRVKFIPETTSQ